MTASAQGQPPALGADGRPTETLPLSQLLRMTLYWFGLSSIFIAVNSILGGRLEFQGLVAAGEEGRALIAMTVGGAIVAMIVQPTKSPPPVQIKSWVSGLRRIKRVSVSERRNRRFSGNRRSSAAWTRFNSLICNDLPIPCTASPVAAHRC